VANAYTSTATVPGIVKAAYDRYIEFALRGQPLLRPLADKRPVQLAMPGSSVVFSLYSDLATNTTPLSEAVDPDSVAINDVSTVTVTLNEYGNVVLETQKLNELAFSDIDPAIANLVAFNMADSLDSLAQTELRAGTNVLYSGTAASTVTVATLTPITGALVRKATSKLRAGNSVPKVGMLYGAYIHPEVAHDLKAEAGTGSFEDIRKYTDTQVGNLISGVTGVVHGAYFVESSRMYQATDGAASARVFRTLFVGQQALAEATAIEPGIVIGPVTDKLMRYRPIGWKGLLGWKRYREQSIYRIETSSSINGV
jgi:N4-gp56 family major capsid protein